MKGDPRTLSFSLVSHTNVGKTTLARTLLRRDVGEVLDQAHVTDENARYPLLETAEGEKLELWDTPGFGDSRRLLALLKDEEDPLGWLARQTWDRVRDRPLWCGQRAVLNAREQADLVLYLVNAVETPEDAGYVGAEMELLGWIGTPVLVLLNQTGPPRVAGERREDEERWRAHLAGAPVALDVLSLDAFTRCWIEEGELFQRAARLLGDERRALCERLWSAWRAERLATFRESMQQIARELSRAACDREPIVEGAWGRDRGMAMRALAKRMEEGSEEALARLVALHGLEGRTAVELRTAMADFATRADSIDPRRAGVMGGVLGGLVAGLGADVLTGGLSLGGGMLAGAIAGGASGAGLARAYSRVRGPREPEMRWSERSLDRTAAEMLLRYLAIAHFGRGRGAWREREHPAFWRQAVGEALASRRVYVHGAWKAARASADPQNLEAVRERLVPLVTGAAREVLVRFYPTAERVL